MISSNYEVKNKDYIDVSIRKNSMKFLNHLWNVQNDNFLSTKKIKNNTQIKLNKNQTKRKSLLNYDKFSNSSNTKHTKKLIDLIELLTCLNQKKSHNSIRYRNFFINLEK